MIVSEAYLRRLLTVALRRIDAPPDHAAVIEGSLAEGFGNDTSDIDFLLIAEGDRNFLTMPALLFIDGRRVEIRMRSRAQIHAQQQRVKQLARSGAARHPATFEDQLNRCQRLSRAVSLRNRALVESVRAGLPAAELEPIVSAWYRHRAQQCARYAAALTALGQPGRAAPWMRTAVTYGAKSWSAARGETYLGMKWTADQFARAVPGRDLAARFAELAGPGRAGRRPARYVHACARLLADLGVDDAEPAAGQLMLVRRRGVTTWQIGERTHVVRGRRHVYALGGLAAAVWRSMAFEAPLPRVLDGLAPAGRARAGALIAEFHRLGLVGLRWRGRARAGEPALDPAPGYLPPGGQGGREPIMSVHGLAMAGGAGEIRLAPMPAKRFAAAGMAHIWANMEVENAREDLAGAVKAAQPMVVHSAAQRLLRYVCVVAISAYGSYPHPAVEEAPSQLAGLRQLPGDLRRRVRELDRALTCDRRLLGEGGDGGAELASQLSDLVTRVRELASGEFPPSFESSDGWQETLEIGYDWVRLGCYLDARFPVEDARDLIASAGQQPNVVVTPPWR